MTGPKAQRRLLNAIAAAQAADRELLDNYLYKFALEQKDRARLAEAVEALADRLIENGVLL
jgi:hypothetical protein